MQQALIPSRIGSLSERRVAGLAAITAALVVAAGVGAQSARAVGTVHAARATHATHAASAASASQAAGAQLRVGVGRADITLDVVNPGISDRGRHGIADRRAGADRWLHTDATRRSCSSTP